MAFLHPSTHRRRSQSASTASSPVGHRRTVDSSRRASTKRAQPHHPFNATSSDANSPKWNIEDWRSKRRRREYLPGIDSLDDELFHRSRHATAPHMPVFPSTPADFHIFPNQPISRSRRRRRSSSPLDIAADVDQEHAYLNSIRSAAFWELRRNVADSGEGFVSGMRDYEHTRSRLDLSPIPSQSLRRGRRQSSSLSNSLRTRTSCPDESSAEEEDVQIFAGESTSLFTFGAADITPSLPHCQSGGSSQSVTSSEPCSSPTDSESSSSMFDSVIIETGQSSKAAPSPSFNLPSTRSEKALAALTLAMANGAGSIHNYSAVDCLQPTFDLDDSHIGEMWH